MTTSVKGEDRLEEIAELVDPWPFQAWRKYVAEYVARGTDEATAHVAANARYGQLLDDARAKARQIAALPCKGGEATDEMVDAGVEYWHNTKALLDDMVRGLYRAMRAAAPSTKPDRESAAGWVKVDEAKWPTGLKSTSNTMLQDEFARFEADRESADEGALAELAQHRNWELSYGYPDEEDEGEWQVHSVTGGRNDREWTLIGRGQTPAAALLSALSKDTEASAGEQQ